MATKFGGLRVTAFVAVAAVLTAGCSDAGPAGPAAYDGIRLSHTGAGAELGHWTLCKEGTSGTFDVTIDGSTSSVSLAAGECTDVFTAEVIEGESTPSTAVTVTEQAQTGVQVDRIEVERFTLSGSTTETLTGTNTVTESIDDDTGVIATFHNEFVGGGEGCTPGYWRQPHHFDSWEGHAPSDLFSSVFDLPSSLARPETLDPNMTLLGALELRGGDVNALTRHAVAALLNAASSGVSYDLSEPDVATAYNAAIDGGDLEGTKDEFEGFNEQGCPLD